MEHETFLSLLRDPAHWGFEMLLIFVFDILIGALLLPRLRKAFRHASKDDRDFHVLLERMNRLELMLRVGTIYAEDLSTHREPMCDDESPDGYFCELVKHHPSKYHVALINEAVRVVWPKEKA